MKNAAPIDIAGILQVPATTKAIIWDMDGVLVDTLTADHGLCVTAAKRVVGSGDWIGIEDVRRNFALDPPSFWAELTRAAPRKVSPQELAKLVEVYDELRAETKFALLPGISEVLTTCDAKGIKCAVASSNPTEVVDDILERAGIKSQFAAVSGLGANGIKPKPAGDLYRRAAEALRVSPSQCAFVEDSITGLTSGKAAGLSYAIAVATGPASFDDLTASTLPDVTYQRFGPRRCTLVDGKPIQKTLDTPNDFASHMAEHIAWRLGVGIDLAWRNDDWYGLGHLIGTSVKRIPFRKGSASALGMIDDGASEVLISLDEPPGLDFSVHSDLSRERIERMRVEQIKAGADLLKMLEGFADGLGAHITARMCTFEDPHHSWEGLFRAVGICLARLRT
ncbi:MAG: HAD-IA family hydrolase [Alphaproteobacteria bacterium]|nr:HAD-IA family hydrolase [Alphaproteobacteria bacterium]